MLSKDKNEVQAYDVYEAEVEQNKNNKRNKNDAATVNNRRNIIVNNS